MSKPSPLRVPEVAEQLGMSPKSVRRFISAGLIPAARPAGPRGHYLVEQAAVDDLWGEIKRQE
jgi:excisionase family DNA binding protein